MFFVFLCLLGCCGLIVPRLSILKVRWPGLIDPQLFLYIDFSALCLAIIGFVGLLYYAKTLGWRLRRVDDLGESHW
jgi:hypothetical protein